MSSWIPVFSWLPQHMPDLSTTIIADKQHIKMSLCFLSKRWISKCWFQSYNFFNTLIKSVSVSCLSMFIEFIVILYVVLTTMIELGNAVSSCCKMLWYLTAKTKLELGSNFELTKGTPYLTSKAKVSGVYCKSVDSKDSKTFIWQRKYMLLDNNPSIFHLMRSKPISYNIHWGKHCGHWTLIGQLHMEGQSMLHFINAFTKDKFATSGDPY